MKTFALVATLMSFFNESWVLDYNMSEQDCETVLQDFEQSGLFVAQVELTCEVEG